MAENKAEVQTFERKSSRRRWVEVAQSVPAVIGKTGLGWGVGFRHFAKGAEPIKEEGDKRSPAGVFSLGPTFGFSQIPQPGHIVLEKDKHICVDDLGSSSYGRIVSRVKAGEKASGEKMSAIPEYRRGAVVSYPANRKVRGGSCIFIHVVSESGEPTSGCVALAEPEVARLQAWVRPGRTAIAIVSEETRTRFGRCLPGAGVSKAP